MRRRKVSAGGAAIGSTSLSTYNNPFVFKLCVLHIGCPCGMPIRRQRICTEFGSWQQVKGYSCYGYLELAYRKRADSCSSRAEPGLRKSGSV